MEVSLIIVNYFTSDHIFNLLNSLKSLNKLDLLEIVIVNNSVEDKGLKKIPVEFPIVKIIEAGDNPGFGAACNIGVKHSHGKYVAFVNPDIRFEKDIFPEMIKFNNLNPNAGFIGGILSDDRSKPVYSFNFFPGYWWEILQALGMGSNNEIKKLLSRKEITIEKKSFEVDWLIGAFLFTSRKVVDEVNGFDERFFLYYEDVDIQFRAKALGYANFCIPHLQLKHFEKSSVSSEKGDDVYHFYMYKSKMMYYYLHFSFFKRNILRIFLLLGLFFRVVFLLPRKSFNNKKKKFKQYQYMLRYFVGNRKTVFENKKI